MSLPSFVTVTLMPRCSDSCITSSSAVMDGHAATVMIASIRHVDTRERRTGGSSADILFMSDSFSDSCSVFLFE